MRPSCEDAVLPLKALGTTPKSGEQVEEHQQRSVNARETATGPPSASLPSDSRAS